MLACVDTLPAAENIMAGPRARTSPINVTTHTIDRPGRTEPETLRHFDSIHAVGGRVFGLDELPDGSIDVTWITTAVPAAEAFGLSPDGSEVVYMPLVGDVPSGELWRERIDTHARIQIAPATVVAAAVAPRKPYTVAFTSAVESGFELAVVNLSTGVTQRVPGHLVMPDFVRIDGEGIVSCFEELDPMLDPAITTSFRTTHSMVFDPRSGHTYSRAQSVEREPRLRSEQISGHRITAEQVSDLGFDIDSGRFTIHGSTILGESDLFAHDNTTNVTADLGSGVILDVLEQGILLRRITPNSSYVEYASFSGAKFTIGTNAILSFTLPMASSTLTQNGQGYGCKTCSSHTLASGEGYAYDFAGPSSVHVLAVASGSVVSSVMTVTCNTGNKGCSTYGSCSDNGGFGNTVIYRLSDGTYIKTAHHQYKSLQSGATNLCPGRYYALQGSTGKAIGTVDPCGAHVHIQRQASADLGGSSSAMYFSELGGTAGVMGTKYPSASKETASCPVTVLMENVEGSAPGWSSATTSGTPWGIEAVTGAHSGTREFTSNLGKSGYANSTDASVVSPSFSLVGFSSGTLTFWTKYRTEANKDFLRIEVSVIGGSWTTLSSFSGTSSGYPNWSQATVSLNAYAGLPNVRIRFRLTSDWLLTDIGVKLDDIQLVAQ